MVIRKINDFDIALDSSKSYGIMLKNSSIIKNNMAKPITFNKLLKVIKGETMMLPLYLTWELTSKCNLNCPFCYIHKKRINKDISFKESKKIIDDMISAGMLGVTLTGGECTLNKDFELIYKYLKENGVLVTVYSNGIKLKENVFEMFNILPPMRVEISIYKPMSLESRPFINAIRLKKMGINVILKLTVTTETFSLYEEIKRFSNENEIIFKFDSDIFDLSKNNKISKYQLPDNEKLYFDKIKYKDITNKPQLKQCFECGAGNVAIYLNSKFELGFCSKANIWFSLYEYSFSEAYGKLKSIVKRYKGVAFESECLQCNASTICHMCYAKSKIIGDEVMADKNYCSKMQRYASNLFKE